MVVPESQRKAARKYQKNNIKTLSINLSIKYDSDIISHLETINNKARYIKELIRKDMK